jgi:hypothetical protein
MMTRSTDKSVKLLYSQLEHTFNGIYANPHKTLSKLFEDALLSVNQEFYGILLTPHINNRWSIFVMFNKSQNVIPLELSKAKEDLSLVIDNLKHTATAFIQSLEEKSKELATKAHNDLIGEWVVLDLSKLKRKIKRIKSSDDQTTLSSLEVKVRMLRRDLWDLEDDIKAHLGTTGLENILSKYKDDFPLGVSAALTYSAQS